MTNGQTLGIFAFLFLSVPGAAADDASFFETKIRPVLADQCYSCHGPQKQKSNLRLDTPAAILKGGDRGPAVIPGNPDKSPLIQAIAYEDDAFRMPPRSKLKQEHIADFRAWVQQGAVAPKTPGSTDAASPRSEFNLAERRQHWCYQPVRPTPFPDIKDPTWSLTAVDPFLLAKLETANLKPAPEADKRTLLRRVTFDLIGLPPTPREIEDFLADHTVDAFPRVVERLLASPHYGERWGRHWLDLVRYAETLGHEFDADIHNAWRYRDYVVRAFNQDLPYHQFVREHVAGDLLTGPRTRAGESVIATAFWWLGEEKHSPVDVRQAQADRIDNQIDVFGKTFLAQTIACARCHDHKFDAITTEDYYSLAGYLKSSRYQQFPLVDDVQLKRLRESRAGAVTEALTALRSDVASLADYLSTAQEALHSKMESPDLLERLAQQKSLDAARLARWVRALGEIEIGQPAHPLNAWHRMAASVAASRSWEVECSRVLEETRQARKPGSQAGAGLDATPLGDTSRSWFASGAAFQGSPARHTDVFLHPRQGRTGLRFIPSGQAHSGQASTHLEGSLRSRTFTIESPYIQFLAAGYRGKLNLIIDGYTLISNPIYGGLAVEFNNAKLAWHTMDVRMWKGHDAYIELVDGITPNRISQGQSLLPAAKDAYVILDSIRFADAPTSPASGCSELGSLALAGTKVDSLATLAVRYQELAQTAIDVSLRTAAHDGEEPLPASRNLDRAVIEFLNWLLDKELLAEPPIGKIVEEFARLESALPAIRCTPALCDGAGEEEVVFLRGNHRTPGKPAPRRLPVVIGGPNQPLPVAGSGRLEMADRLVSPANPLLARVLVNRLWQHHFGEGLVRSVDDFGRMGEPPSHPELLDYLAAEFVRSNWSIKYMHRLMILSRAYRMSSKSDEVADRVDPGNRLLHRMPVRRLEAEAIRDAVLAVSGRLDRRMEGPGVPPYLTPFMEGRGRPASSGPLDGMGRRSIYLNVRRNFLNPLFLAFDSPIPFSSIGRRTVSNVPAQALTMMNDPFLFEEAKRWSEAVLSIPRNDRDRIAAMYAQAYGRPPSDMEIDEAIRFLASQRTAYGANAADARPWADLGHVLFNVKEFIYVE